MKSWFYFDRPTNMAFHDFTSYINPPPNLRSLLGLGLKFIPTPRYTTTKKRITGEGEGKIDPKATLPKFKNDLHKKIHFAGESPDDEDFNPRMYVASKWKPPEYSFEPSVLHRFHSFKDRIGNLFSKKKGTPNLLPHQRRALAWLRNQDDLLVIQCDKNLGPAVIEKSKYIEMAYRDHFNDEVTYRFLTEMEAKLHAGRIKKTINDFIAKWYIPKNNESALKATEVKFLRSLLKECITAFPAFYLMPKAHKAGPLTSRPVSSCSGSYLYGLGVWVDDKLQKVVKTMQTYFKNSQELKEEITTMAIPDDCLLFTADAVSMYTNIPTNTAIKSIATYLRENSEHFPEVPVEATIEALRIVMKNNILTFGDTAWLQQKGTAMGTPPGGSYANLYFGIHEQKVIREFINSLPLIRRFIDDINSLWRKLGNQAEDDLIWEQFKSRMNECPGLTWIFSKRTTKVDFMDLTLTIHNNKVTTTLYEKELNLHLYIPPHSAHPPGVLSGLVMGNLYRIYTLCSEQEDINQRVGQFYKRLLLRGYKGDKLKPLFLKAEQAAKLPRPEKEEDSNHIFLHLQYHPNDPQSPELQEAWRTTMVEPPGFEQLPKIKNFKRQEIGLDRMIVCYSRPLNLGNLLSYRKLKPTGPPASSYRITGNAGR